MKKASGLIKEIWRNAFGIFKRDIKDTLHNPVAIIVVLGLIVLPSLYAWVNIIACWDPYGNTAGIKVAVVNLDRGVELGGETINAGEKIVDNLRENHSIGWQFVDNDEAEYGVTHGRYYAMLQIPENFSTQLIDVLDGNMRKPEIIYRVNEKSNAIAPKITDTGAKTVTNQVMQAIIEVVDKAAFSVGNEVGESMGNNRNKITRLRDAVIAVNNHFDEVESMLGQAQDDLISVNELLDDVERSVPEIKSGIVNLEDFAAQGNVLLDDAETLKVQSVDYLDDKFAEVLALNEELQSFAVEAKDLVADGRRMQDKIPQIQDTAVKMQNALREFITILSGIDEPDIRYEEIIAKLERADEALTLLKNSLDNVDPKQVQAALTALYEINAQSLKSSLEAVQEAGEAIQTDLAETLPNLLAEIEQTAAEGLAGELSGSDLAEALTAEQEKVMSYIVKYPQLSCQGLYDDLGASAMAVTAGEDYNDLLRAVQADCAAITEGIPAQQMRSAEETAAVIERITSAQASNEEQLGAVKDMSEDEIQANIVQIQNDLVYLQNLIGQAESAVTRLQDRDIHIADVIAALRYADGEIDAAQGMLRRLDETMTDGLRLADDGIDLLQSTGRDVEQAIDDLRGAYNDRWNQAVEAMLGDLRGSLGNLDVVLANANDALPRMDELLAKGLDMSGQGQELLDKFNEELPTVRADIARASEAMDKLTDDNLDFLIEILGYDSQSMSEYFSGPVQLTEERMYHIDNYGSAMTPFYTVLALWVGCLLLSAMLSVEAKPLVAGQKLRQVEIYFGKMMTFMLLTLLQSLVVALGDKYVLGIMVTDLPLFLISCLFTSFIFTLIVYTMVSLLETIGKAVCVVFLVLQLAGAGGTFPVEVMPQFYQIMQPYLPFTYAIGTLREAVAGPLWDNVVHDYQMLCLFGVLFLIIGLLLKKPLHPLISWFMKKFKQSIISE